MSLQLSRTQRRITVYNMTSVMISARPELRGAGQSPFRQEDIKYARTLYENKNHEMSERETVRLEDVGNRLWKEGYKLLSPGQLGRFVFTGCRDQEEPLSTLTPYAWYTIVRLWSAAWWTNDIVNELYPAFNELPPGRLPKSDLLDLSSPTKPILRELVRVFIYQAMRSNTLKEEATMTDPYEILRLRQKLLSEFCYQSRLDRCRTRPDEKPSLSTLTKGVHY